MIRPVDLGADDLIRLDSTRTRPDDGRSRGYLGDDFNDLDDLDLDLDDDDHDLRLQRLLITLASILLSRPLHASRRKSFPSPLLPR